MSNQDIFRAWKDLDYRSGLSEEELERVPANPVGEALSDLDLLAVQGGAIGPVSTTTTSTVSTLTVTTTTTITTTTCLTN